MAADFSADQVISRLKLAPHPEGGYYRETFRDVRCVDGGRAASTAIYFLLPAGVISRWHRVDAAEAWHWYAGAPLRLSFGPDANAIRDITLAGLLDAASEPQAVVPAGWWQRAESLGAWTLVGCTVAPGFSFEGFEIVDGDAIPRSP